MPQASFKENPLQEKKKANCFFDFFECLQLTKICVKGFQCLLAFSFNGPLS